MLKGENKIEIVALGLAVLLLPYRKRADQGRRVNKAVNLWPAPRFYGQPQ